MPAAPATRDAPLLHRWGYSLLLVALLAVVLVLALVLGRDPGIEHGCGERLLHQPYVECVQG